MAKRPVSMKILNRSGYTLMRKKIEIEHGKLTVGPPTDIPIDTESSKWKAQEKTGALIGPKGSVTYSLNSGGENVDVTFSWNHPFSGATSAYTVVTNPRGKLSYEIKPPNPEGHEQWITYGIVAHSPYTPIDQKDWMKDLPDSQPLSEITLPGTHDTCTWDATPIAKCQTLTLKQQLQVGIRYIDIRCKTKSGCLKLYHGIVPLNLEFKQHVVDICFEFLASHPSECIVLLMSNEDSKNQNEFEKLFRESVEEDTERWHLDNKCPVLGDVRGKIVLLRRFDVDLQSKPLGIDVTNWRENQTFEISNGVEFRIQDQYKVSTVFEIPDKWKNIQRLLNNAREGLEGKWFINYCSGASAGAYPNIIAKGSAVQLGENEQLMNYLFGMKNKTPLGTIALDFPEYPSNKRLIETIINNNFDNTAETEKRQNTN